jgi:hypothetical protein
MRSGHHAKRLYNRADAVKTLYDKEPGREFVVALDTEVPLGDPGRANSCRSRRIRRLALAVTDFFYFTAKRISGCFQGHGKFPRLFGAQIGLCKVTV